MKWSRYNINENTSWGKRGGKTPYCDGLQKDHMGTEVGADLGNGAEEWVNQVEKDWDLGR